MADSRVYSFRAHPSNPHEAEFIKIMGELEEMGFAPRQIIVDAVLRASGKTPEMFDSVDAKNVSSRMVADLLVQMQTMLQEFARDMIVNRDQMLGSVEDVDNIDDDELDGIAAAWLKRRSSNDS